MDASNFQASLLASINTHTNLINNVPNWDGWISFNQKFIIDDDFHNVCQSWGNPSSPLLKEIKMVPLTHWITKEMTQKYWTKSKFPDGGKNTLKNSVNDFGACVRQSAAAQYSTLYPRSSKRVHNQRSSPIQTVVRKRCKSHNYYPDLHTQTMMKFRCIFWDSKRLQASPYQDPTVEFD